MAIWVEFSSPIGKYFEALSASSGTGFSPAAGGVRRKAQAGDFQVSKYTDELSPKLLRHTALGTVFDLVAIELYSDKTNILYLTYKLTNVLITSFQAIGGYGDEIQTESMTLNATKVTWEQFKP